MRGLSHTCAAILIALLLSACGRGGMVIVDVGSDRYEVPKDRLIKTEFSFLPNSQNNTLRFYLTSLSSGEGAILVSAQDAKTLCSVPDSQSPDYRNSACADGTPRISESNLKRVDVEGAAGSQWDYIDASGHRVAACYSGTREGDRCVSYGRYRDTIFSVRFADHKINDLGKITADTKETLDNWYVGSAI